MIITKKEYMNKEKTFREFYGQFITENDIRRVEERIGRETILNSSDPSFNDIPLRKWDLIGSTDGSYRQTAPKRWHDIMKEAGSFLSHSECICIYKECARIIRDREKEKSDTKK